MIAILSLLVIVQVSLIVMRGAAVALERTGLDRDVARFQARSAFTGAGFTTGESEHVVRPLARRRIVMWLMLAGNIGFVSATSTLLLSLVDIRSSTTIWAMAGLLFGGLVLVCLLETNKTVDRLMCGFFGRVLRRTFEKESAPRALLEVDDGFWVSEVLVRAGGWLDGLSLESAALESEGLQVLGLRVDGESYLGEAASDNLLQAGDRLTVYGLGERIAALDDRPAGAPGERAHEEAVIARRAGGCGRGGNEE